MYAGHVPYVSMAFTPRWVKGKVGTSISIFGGGAIEGWRKLVSRESYHPMRNTSIRETADTSVSLPSPFTGLSPAFEVISISLIRVHLTIKGSYDEH